MTKLRNAPKLNTDRLPLDNDHYINIRCILTDRYLNDKKLNEDPVNYVPFIRVNNSSTPPDSTYKYNTEGGYEPDSLSDEESESESDYEENPYDGVIEYKLNNYLPNIEDFVFQRDFQMCQCIYNSTCDLLSKIKIFCISCSEDWVDFSEYCIENRIMM